jgi:phosphatidate phosphatase PAH1
VIIVAPSAKSANTGVAASSDFYASFPSSLVKSKKNSITSTAKRLTSFMKSSSNVSTASSVSEGDGEEDLFSQTITSSSTSTQTNNVSSAVVTPKGNVQVRINGRYISKLDMIFSKNTSSCRFVHGNGLRPSVETLNMIIDGTSDSDQSEETTCTCSEAVKNSEHHLCVKNNKSNGEGQSNVPILKSGRNLIRYTLVSENGVAIASTEANIYLWSALDSVIVSDIDGTVTKDNVGGVVDTLVQEKFAHIHSGICKFYQQLTTISPVEDMNVLNSSDDGKGQVRFMYLSSRPISIVNQTRKLLVSVSQICDANECHNLPPGPVMCNVVPLTSVLYSELVSKNVHMFKSDVLARQVVLPFVAARGHDWSKIKTAKSARTLRATELHEIDENVRCFSDSANRPFTEMSDPTMKDDRLFLAGFGNTMRDAMAYEMAGMDRDDIYIIDTKSRIMCMGEQSRSQSFEDSISSDCIPDTEWISDAVNRACCLGQVVPGDERKSQDLSNGSKVMSPSNNSVRAVFDEPSKDDWGESDSPRKSNKKSAKAGSSVTQSIRAFTTKKSFAKFPSFASSSSSKSSSKKVLYQGYDDPRLLEAVRKRMQGDYDPFPVRTRMSV